MSRKRRLFRVGFCASSIAISGLTANSLGQELAPVVRAITIPASKKAIEVQPKYRTAINPFHPQHVAELVLGHDTALETRPGMPAATQPSPPVDTRTAPVTTQTIPVATQTIPVVNETPAVASQYAPWWEQEVGQAKRAGQSVDVNVNSLLMSALRNSAQIRVFSDLPLIRETAITEADAAFDWTGFMEARWDDTNEPVGSTLTTGGPPRFENKNFAYSVGGRRRNTIGGQFEVSQRIGHQNNNSVFFLPNDQGTSRLTASYTQPLMRGGGRVYNTSLTVLAQIDSKIARDEFSRQLQSHLLEVTRAYWSLYLERAGLLQRQRLLSRAEEIMNDLERRQELDTVNSQVVRARSAVESRRAEIVRAEMAVKNAESRIRSLTNDPSWGSSDEVELLPADVPFRGFMPADMHTAVSTAMRSRPEIGQAIKQVKAACVRMNMAKNEILPMLNLVLESYLSGLQGDSDIGGAWGDQFTEGEPSYSIGLQYEYPIWNRAAKARLQRRRLEVRQLQNQFQTTAETLKLEVAVAVRELATSFKEMEAKNRAMNAANEEVEYISERWRALGAEDRSASLVLEDLLNAQGRLADSEYGFLNAGLTYNLALMNYKKAIGTLLQDESIALSRNCKCCLPGQTAGKVNGTCEVCNPGVVQQKQQQEVTPVLDGHLKMHAKMRSAPVGYTQTSVPGVQTGPYGVEPSNVVDSPAEELSDRSFASPAIPQPTGF